MITLIIFLCLLIIFGFVVFKKVKINMELNTEGIDYIFKVIFFSKELVRKGNILEFFKSGEGKFDLELIKEISSIINVSKLNTHIEIGTEFIFLTNVVTVFLATAIPMLYNFPVNSKKDLSFDIKPYYDRFCLVAEIKSEIELTVLDFLIIYLSLKKYEFEFAKKKYT